MRWILIKAEPGTVADGASLAFLPYSGKVKEMFRGETGQASAPRGEVLRWPEQLLKEQMELQQLHRSLGFA